MKHRIFAIAIFLMLTVFRLCAASPVRVAIIADEASQPVADLLTKELSAREGINLLERADLSKLGDEAKLQKLVAQDSVATGKLLGADGLIFLRTDAQGVQARFTAVKLGYALFDGKAAAGGNVEQLAKALAHKVEGYAPKLDLDPTRAVPVSVLNLRADYAAKGSVDMERKLTLLLESRLAALPEYVVLERRHAWDVGFEHSVSDVSQPLLKGAFVIDGTLKVPGEAGGEMVVALRLRAPDGHETPFEIRGAMNDLPGLVEKISAKIQEATGGGEAAQWNPEKEAQEYLGEGVWGWQHNANASALEALDSAELLGGNIADVEAVRLLVLGKSINEGMENWYPKVSALDRPPAVAAAVLSQKMELAMRAIPELIRYRDEKMESGLRAFPKEIPVASATFKTQYEEELVVYPLSKLLVLLDAAGDARADELRAAIRPVTQYDPLHGKMGLRMSTRMNNGVMSEVFADDWAQTLDEELACYRLMCSAENYYLPYDLTYWREERFCPRFAKDAAGRKEIFDKFVESLKEIPGARLPCLVLQAGSSDGAAADAAFKACLDAMWEKRDALASPHFHEEWGNLGAIHGDAIRRNYKAMLPLLHYFLTHATDHIHSRSALNLMWRCREWTEEEAGAVWKNFLAYKARTNAGETQYEKEFLGKFPQLAGAAPVPLDTGGADINSPHLVVSRVWYPPEMTEGNRFLVNGGSWVTTPDGVWIAGEIDSDKSVGGLYHVRLDNFETESLPSAKNVYPRNILVTRDAVYLVCLTPGQNQKTMIERYDFKLKEWTEHEVPGTTQIPGSDKIYEVAGKLYLCLKTPDGDSGIARYDGNTGEMTMLASSRRKPALNQFDDGPPYLVDAIFAGPGGKPCATIWMDNGKTESYYISEESGAWVPLTRAGMLFRAQTDGRRTLLYGPGSFKSRSDIAVMIDPAKTGPELWMGVATPWPETGFPNPEKAPLPETPSWGQKAVWPVSAGAHINADDYGFRNDELFSLLPAKSSNGMRELLWYQRNKAEPIHIPLSFEINETTANALKGILPEGTQKILGRSDSTKYITCMIVTPQGICFPYMAVGFWYLPFTDIDAFLKTHPQGAPESPLPAASRINTPGPRKNSSGRDEVDPGDPSSFP